MFKKLLAILLFSAASLLAQFAGGSGTSINPYQISTPTQLDSVRDYPSAYFIMTQDINMGGRNWTPIASFYGSFDGAHHTIDSLTINGHYANVGFIGSAGSGVQGTTIKNLGLKSPIFHDTVSGYPLYGGVIVGQVVSGSSTVTIDSIVITNMDILFSRTDHAEWEVGGIVGNTVSSTIISRCAILGDTLYAYMYSAPDYRDIGGIVGLVSASTTISKSFVSNLVMVGNEYGVYHMTNVGGLVGDGGSVTVTDCYVKGTKFGVYSGSTTDGRQIGGLISGYASTGSSFTNCYVIDSTIALYTDPNISKGTFMAPVVGNVFTASSIYADTTISSPLGFTNYPTTAGTNNTSDLLMKAKSTYTGWDFTNTWGIDSTFNGGYPYLLWAMIPTIILPFDGEQFNQGDSVTLQIIPIDTLTRVIYITYDGSTYDSLGIMVGNVEKFKLDTISSVAKLKLVQQSNGVTAYSNIFVIQTSKALTITKVVFVTPPTTANINILVSTRGISNMTAYYSADSVVWKQIRQFSIPSLSTTHIDTLVTSIPFPMIDSAYFKVVEFYDTTTYDFNPAVQVGEYRAFPEGNVCISWSYNGLGSIWRQDVSCGWVGTIDILTGVTSISIGSDGSISSSTTYTDYVNDSSEINPATGYTYITTMPAARPWQVAPYPAYNTGSFGVTSAASPVTLNGRQYWWSNNILYQHDLVNNITTSIMNMQYAIGAGAVDFSDQVGIGSSGSFLLFANLPGHGWPNVIMLKNYPYPPDKSYTSLVSVYHNSSTAGAIDPGTGITYNTYRGMFRGIDPKIKR